VIKDQLDNNWAYAVWCILGTMIVLGCVFLVLGLLLWVLSPIL
jgi:hypothetical protein